MSAAATWAVVPVKRFLTAKNRLAPLLDSIERAELARMMLEDVLDALALCNDLLAGMIVVTADEDATLLARRRGAVIVADIAERGINAALELAVRYFSRMPDAGMIVIPSDIPQLSSSALAQTVAAISMPRSVAAIPATGDGGTNLLACRPANTISLCFGPRSFERHCRAARRAGIVPHIFAVPDLGLDIDRPEDLTAFLSLKTATRTHAFLSTLAIADRLERRWRREMAEPDRAALGTQS
jgi:2-phospho-L-lactate guanylyltransferase